MRFPALRLARPATLLAGCVIALAGCSSVSLDEPIEARTWRLVNVYGTEVSPGADASADAQVVFSNGQVSGSGGCNRITGSYQRTGASVKIGPLAATRRACTDATRTQVESSFLAALQGTTHYSVVGSDLLLIDGGGQTLAKLSSAAR